MSKTIIDLDIGCDDALALLLALSSPHLNLLALTTTFGNTSRSNVDLNLRKVFYQLDHHLDQQGEEERAFWPGLLMDGERKKILVGSGAEEPLVLEEETAAYFHGPDGLSNIAITHPHLTPPSTYQSPYLEHSTLCSSDLILDLLRTEPEKSVTVVALGPLTNVALAIQKDPASFARVRRVIWMGGALDVPGNTSSVAEFNAYADPHAASIVFSASMSSSSSINNTEAAFETIICPLDITTPHIIPFADLLSPSHSSPAAEAAGRTNKAEPVTGLRTFTDSFLAGTRKVYASLNGGDAMEQHDGSVVWFAIALAATEQAAAAASTSSTLTPSTVQPRASVEDIMATSKQGGGSWVVQSRAFEMECSGLLTRGMCVVDRRGKTETPGEIRSKSGIHSTLTSADPTDPSLASNVNGTQDAEKKEVKRLEKGIRVLVKTPGSEAYERAFLEAVFGREERVRQRYAR